MSDLIKSVEQFYKEGLEIIKKKNKDYGTPDDPFLNFRLGEQGGISVEQAIYARMCDKMARLGKVVQKQDLAVLDDSAKDSLLDLANLAAILNAYLDDDSDFEYTKILEVEYKNKEEEHNKCNVCGKPKKVCESNNDGEYLSLDFQCIFCGERTRSVVKQTANKPK